MELRHLKDPKVATISRFWLPAGTVVENRGSHPRGFVFTALPAAPRSSSRLVRTLQVWQALVVKGIHTLIVNILSDFVLKSRNS